MEDTSVHLLTGRDFTGIVQKTLDEAEELAALIERAVQTETAWGVADLTVDVGRRGVELRGHCETYYLKQLAQHAAMQVPGGERLVNSIEVS